MTIDDIGKIALADIAHVKALGGLGRTIEVLKSDGSTVRFTLTQGDTGAVKFAEMLNAVVSGRPDTTAQGAASGAAAQAARPILPQIGTPVFVNRIGPLLGLGIVFMPYIFSLWTLRRGHTARERVLSLGWALIVIGALVYTRLYPPVIVEQASSSSVGTAAVASVLAEQAPVVANNGSEAIAELEALIKDEDAQAEALGAKFQDPGANTSEVLGADSFVDQSRLAESRDRLEKYRRS